MFVKQVSVFLENVSGALCELTSIPGNAGIDLMAMSVADTANFGIVRFIVRSSDMERFSALLTEKGYTNRINHVLCISVPDRAAGLYEVLSVLEKKEIAVEYLYSFIRPTAQKALLILRPSDKDAAARALTDAGVELISQEEVDGLRK